MHHSGNAPLMLRFDGNDKALSAYGDEIFLGASPFRQPAQRAAQTLFNHSLLALDFAPDTAQISRGVVAQRAIGIKTRPKRARQLRKLRACGQLAQRLQPAEPGGHRFRRALDECLPGGDVVHQQKQIANLFRFE